MNKAIISNVTIYKAIAEEAYSEMVQLVNSGRKRKTDGSDGWIVQLDPEQKSFKKAMVSIVFTGMWLEALTHLLIVKNFGEKKFKEYDFKSYEEKLELLGVTEKETIEKVIKFRNTRKELVHEKAYFDKGEIKTAQEEAANANEMLHEIHSVVSKQG